MRYGRYQFTSRLESEAILPYYKGSTFRGVFGIALKKVVCALKRLVCSECLLKQRCVYALAFETSGSLNLPEKSRIASPPHPFVIEPPLTNERDFSKEDSFDFNLLLFGEINNSLPYFIYAFDQMGRIGVGKRINGKRGQFALKRVKLDGKIIYTDTDQKLNIDESFATLSLSEPNNYSQNNFRLKITLETPLRIKFENRLKTDLPFHALVRAMLRRVSSLHNFYGGGEPPLDYRGLVKRADAIRIIETDLRWFDWERYSNRQEQRMMMGGISGSITYEGHMMEYMPLVDFCSEVHIGKQTSFGLGKFKGEILK
ncbi:MAG TPA: CRISPR system precrRNA processing endoribonuclease RAMP protein Cas6 [Desulfobacterales bacterium]|nr:CRISPR system precrRNA processing endoribonuclease RAMP protein Cas6 [Desulfobacterales bacterium]